MGVVVRLLYNHRCWWKFIWCDVTRSCFKVLLMLCSVFSSLTSGLILSWKLFHQVQTFNIIPKAWSFFRHFIAKILHLYVFKSAKRHFIKSITHKIFLRNIQIGEKTAFCDFFFSFLSRKTHCPSFPEYSCASLICWLNQCDRHCIDLSKILHFLHISLLRFCPQLLKVRVRGRIRWICWNTNVTSNR